MAAFSASGSDSVEAISYRVGYEDAASFRRLFKRLTGMPPGDYRLELTVSGAGGEGAEAGATVSQRVRVER